MRKSLPSNWATDGAPDAISAAHAVRVQEMMELPLDPVEYIMEVHGETREHAELIVRNCRGANDEVSASAEVKKALN